MDLVWLGAEDPKISRLAQGKLLVQLFLPPIDECFKKNLGDFEQMSSVRVIRRTAATIYSMENVDSRHIVDELSWTVA